MKLSRVLAVEAAKSKGRMIISEVPSDKQPSASTIKRLEREIQAQINANDAVCMRSMTERR